MSVLSSPKWIGGMLLVWSALTALTGWGMERSQAQDSATNAKATGTAIAREHVRATARAVAHATSVVKAHRRATLQAVAAKTAAPGKTAAAASQQTAQAVAHAQVSATAQAVAQANATATSQAQAQANADATQAAAPSGDTYADVNDHPQDHIGDKIEWTCNVYKFLDQNTIGCWEYTGTYQGGTGDGSVILDVSSVDTSTIHSGDDVRVYGEVTNPAQGTNAYGATITSPAIIVKQITDLGHDPNASP